MFEALSRALILLVKIADRIGPAAAIKMAALTITISATLNILDTRPTNEAKEDSYNCYNQKQVHNRTQAIYEEAERPRDNEYHCYGIK